MHCAGKKGKNGVGGGGVINLWFTVDEFLIDFFSLSISSNIRG